MGPNNYAKLKYSSSSINAHLTIFMSTFPLSNKKKALKTLDFGVSH